VLVDAAVLTVVGMTTVFGFLSLLVCLMHLSARVIARFPGAPDVVPSTPPRRMVASADDAQIAAVLAVVASQRGER
jgi:sodium pump decarboxylase gamma subunit